MTSVGLHFGNLSDLRVASYIKSCHGRGKTVSGRVRLALIWMQRIADLPLGAGNVELQKMTKSSWPEPKAEPDAAKTIPIEVNRTHLGSPYLLWPWLPPYFRY